MPHKNAQQLQDSCHWYSYPSNHVCGFLYIEDDMNNIDHSSSLITRGLKLSHLRMMAAFAQTAHMGQAAHVLGITQPAASRLVAEIERICGYAVHTRAGRGVELTEVGHALAQRAARILMELRETAREVNEFGQGSLGQVAIGAVTAPALDIVLPSLRMVEMAYPNMKIDVTVSSSDLLYAQLLDGTLDFIIARIPSGVAAQGVDAQMVAGEPVDLVVRKSHPLAQAGQVTVDDVMAFDWVLPNRGNLLADTVLARLSELGHPPPKQRLSTSSFLLTLALLQQSNSIAPLSAAVAKEFTAHGNLVRLNIDLGIHVAPYSVLTRRGAAMPLAARNVLRIIGEFIAQQASEKPLQRL